MEPSSSAEQRLETAWKATSTPAICVTRREKDTPLDGLTGGATMGHLALERKLLILKGFSFY